MLEQCRADTTFSNTGCHGREGSIACQTTASETATKKCAATPAVEVRDEGEAKSTAEHERAVEAMADEIPHDVGQEKRQVEEACPHHEQVKSTHAQQRRASVTDVPIQDVKDMAQAYHQGYLHYQAHRSLRASLHIGPGVQKKIQYRHEVKGVERGTGPKHQLLQQSKALAPSADSPRGPENVLARCSVVTALGADLADVGRVQGSEPAGHLPFLQEWLDSKRALSEDAALLESSGLLELGGQL